MTDCILYYIVCVVCTAHSPQKKLIIVPHEHSCKTVLCIYICKRYCLGSHSLLCLYYICYKAGPHSVKVVVRITSASDVCHRGCAYAVFQTVHRPGLCSVVDGTVHYNNPLKLFERVENSPELGLSSVAILPWLYRKGFKTILTQSLTSTRGTFTN